MSGVIHTRINEPVTVPDQEIEISQRFLDQIVTRLERSAKAIAIQIEDRTRPVDEYTGAFQATDAATQVEVFPQWNDNIRERITSILIYAPPNATGAVQLGSDWYMPVVMPPSGVLVIAPLSILLDRSDRRLFTLTSASPSNGGPMGMRLSGWASGRY
jgi:hypothetical protein